MKITRDVIRGAVEEEIEEARFRKKVRERVKRVVKERKERKVASQHLPKIKESIDSVMNEVSEEYDQLTSDLKKVKEAYDVVKEKYGVE